MAASYLQGYPVTATHPTCRCGCGREATGRTGLTTSCRQRWYQAGRPDDFPPPRWTWTGTWAGRGTREDRIDEYAELRSWGLSRAEAAVRLGLCRRTIERYESHLRKANAA
jgi:hypothetical protein